MTETIQQQAIKVMMNFTTIHQWHSQGRCIVFTNGCFDLLHPGHIDYLQRARALGDKLIVGLNSDDSIRALKGASRPINALADRTIMLAALRSVDLVIPFSEETPLELITAIQPDILVKGGDYQVDTIVGADLVRSHGGQVIIIPFVDGHSSTQLIARIKAE
ncbi:MAG: D-glycero-beta-D-manno-heptose 1-phosphate adenylyltransferase [Mariprofundus sp.]|nr:D-glycero-beta-D-manno-heptose 1-phosphate adenylyltransferase [Mariprofundus sp.]